MNQLEKHGIPYDIYVHCWIDVNKVFAPRSIPPETGHKIDSQAWRELQPTAVITAQQRIFDQSKLCTDLVRHMWTIGKPPTYTTSTLRNMARTYQGLKAVTSLWKSEPDYSAYLYLRPDLLYLTALKYPDLNLVFSAQDDLILTPRWATHKGMNDRIALGTRGAMERYGNRIQEAFNFGNSLQRENYHEFAEEWKGFHTETFLSWLMLGINRMPLDIQASRARSNGFLEKGDEKWCPDLHNKAQKMIASNLAITKNSF